MRTVPLLPPEEGRVENPWFHFFLFCHIAKERAISLSPRLSGSGADSEQRTASSLALTTPPFDRSQETAVRGHNVSPHISGQSLQERGEFCCTQSERNAFCAIQHDFPPLHHCGNVVCSFGPTSTEFGGVAYAAQLVLLDHSDILTRLCVSVL